MPNKKAKLDDGHASMETTDGMPSGGQPGSSLPGGTGASVASVIIHNPNDTTTIPLRFKKTFQLYTGGYQFLKANVGQIASSTGFRLDRSPFPNLTTGYVTPLACLPPDIMALYMTPAQFENIPSWTFAKTCRIKITPLGYRMPFATNEADSTYANSQTLVQIAYSVGLNTKWNCITAGYTAAEADLTLPTGYDTNFDWADMMYDTAGEGEEPTNIGAIMGVPKLLNYYTTLVPGKLTNESIPLIDHIMIQNVNDCKGCPIINYEYTFKNGLLKLPPAVFAQRRGQQTGWSIPQAIGENPPPLLNGQESYTNNLPSQTVESLNGTNYNQYDWLIEKAPLLNRQLGQSNQPDRPPLVHFGCMPVQANAALAATPVYSNVVIQWMVETELICETNFRYADSENAMAYLGSYDPNVFSTPAIMDEILTDSTPKFYISNRLSSPSYTGVIP